jgi:hypothetical protein
MYTLEIWHIRRSFNYKDFDRKIPRLSTAQSEHFKNSWSHVAYTKWPVSESILRRVRQTCNNQHASQHVYR